MKDLFLPYQQSLELRELGFDEICLTHYWGENILNEAYGGWMKNSNTKYVMAPTWEQAFKWLRENYDWQHSIEPTADQHSHKLGYNYWIWNYKTGEEYHSMPKNRPSGDWVYETYEKAQLTCLNEIIKLIKTK